MTHVFQTHVHTEHVLQVLDLSNVVVIRGTLEQHVVSVFVSNNSFTSDD